MDRIKHMVEGGNKGYITSGLKNWYQVAMIMVMVMCVACQTTTVTEELSIDIGLSDAVHTRIVQLLDYEVDSMSFPRSYNMEQSAINKVPSSDWTSGFYPGSLWLIYNLTGEEAFRTRAEEWTQYIEREKWNNRTHDMGFKVYCSFGNGYEMTDNEAYKSIILKSAETLSSRFNKNVGCIRSWDFNADIWEFPVIIDNMMNLELLFEATRLSGDSTYHDIAVTHANTTLEHHYRDDESSVHVVVFDTLTGAVLQTVTHQGYNDESSWARGQAWGIYGFTMSYRYTKNPMFLERAIASANFFIKNSDKRQDKIAYWDFNDPNIPESPRDVSASTILASALVELAGYSDQPSYIDYARGIINTLQSSEYVLSEEYKVPFILNHCTGNYPADDEIDVPLAYGDYYFLEAISRLQSIN